MKKYFLLILILLSLFTVSAHQPRVEESNTIIVDNPEISKAYYTELKGEVHTYFIESNSDFNLYVNILVAYDSDRRDFIVDIYENENLLESLNDEKYNWTYFNEPIAGDEYWMGPEYDVKATGGNYKIVVSSSDNTGKYVLATGKIEKFGFMDTIRTIAVLPKIKSDFFDKPSLSAYNNKFGFFLVIILSILFTIYLVLKNKLINYYNDRKFNKKIGARTLRPKIKR